MGGIADENFEVSLSETKMNGWIKCLFITNWIYADDEWYFVYDDIDILDISDDIL